MGIPINCCWIRFRPGTICGLSIFVDGFRLAPKFSSLHKNRPTLWPNSLGPLHDPVTWYGINFAGTQVKQWDFQNKGTCTSPARLSFVLKVPVCKLRPDRAKSRFLCDKLRIEEPHEKWLRLIWLPL